MAKTAPTAAPALTTLRPAKAHHQYLAARRDLIRLQDEIRATEQARAANAEAVGAAKSGDHRRAHDVLAALNSGKQPEGNAKLDTLLAVRREIVQRLRDLDDARTLAVAKFTDAAVNLRTEFAAQLRNQGREPVRAAVVILVAVARRVAGGEPEAAAELADLIPAVAKEFGDVPLGALSDPRSIVSAVVGAALAAEHLDEHTIADRHLLSEARWEPAEGWSAFRSDRFAAFQKGKKNDRASRRAARQAEPTGRASW